MMVFNINHPNIQSNNKIRHFFCFKVFLLLLLLLQEGDGVLGMETEESLIPLLPLSLMISP